MSLISRILRMFFGEKEVLNDTEITRDDVLTVVENLINEPCQPDDVLTVVENLINEPCQPEEFIGTPCQPEEFIGPPCLDELMVKPLFSGFLLPGILTGVATYFWYKRQSKEVQNKVDETTMKLIENNPTAIKFFNIMQPALQALIREMSEEEQAAFVANIDDDKLKGFQKMNEEQRISMVEGIQTSARRELLAKAQETVKQIKQEEQKVAEIIAQEPVLFCGTMTLGVMMTKLANNPKAQEIVTQAYPHMGNLASEFAKLNAVQLNIFAKRVDGRIDKWATTSAAGKKEMLDRLTKADENTPALKTTPLVRASAARTKAAEQAKTDAQPNLRASQKPN